MQKDRLKQAEYRAIMPAVPKGRLEETGVLAFKKHMVGGFMRIRIDRNPRVVAPVARALEWPRALFGESLPELVLAVAVFAAVARAALSLNGAL